MRNKKVNTLTAKKNAMQTGIDLIYFYLVKNNLKIGII